MLPVMRKWTKSTAHKLRVNEIRQVLREHGLSVDGLKPELVLRLVEASEKALNAPNAALQEKAAPVASAASASSPAASFAAGFAAEASATSFSQVLEDIEKNCAKLLPEQTLKREVVGDVQEGNWLPATSPSGHRYYYHITTRETAWTLPEGEQVYVPADGSESKGNLEAPSHAPPGSGAVELRVRFASMRERAAADPSGFPTKDAFVAEVDRLLQDIVSISRAPPDETAAVLGTCRDLLRTLNAEASLGIADGGVPSTVDFALDDDVAIVSEHSDIAARVPYRDCICGSDMVASVPDFDVVCSACSSICHAECVVPESVALGAESWELSSASKSYRCPKCLNPAAFDVCSKCRIRFNNSLACFEHEETCSGGAISLRAESANITRAQHDIESDEEVECLDLTRSSSFAAKSEADIMLQKRKESRASKESVSEEADAKARATIESLSSEGFRHDQEGWLPYEPPVGMHANGVSLKYHQAVAVNWMLAREQDRGGVRGGLLLDEAGLGKTLTSLTVCRASFVKGECRQPTLIICPPGLMWTWANETKHFNDEFTAIWYYGDYRREIKRKLGDVASKWRDAIRQCDFVFASYEGLTNEYKYNGKKRMADSTEEVVRFPPNSIFHYGEEFGRVILDESHYIRNRDIARSRAARALVGIPRRWCVTATPVHNRLDDYFAQLAFVRVVPTFGEWTAMFVTPMEHNLARGLEKLLKMLAPISLRREKKELLDLPPMEQVTQRIRLSKAEDEFYVAVFEYSQAKARKTLNFVAKLKEMHARKQIMGSAYVSSLAQQRTELWSLIFRLRLTCVAPSVAFAAIERELHSGKSSPLDESEFELDTFAKEMTEDEAQLLQSGVSAAVSFTSSTAVGGGPREIISSADLSRGIALLRAAAIRINQGDRAGAADDDEEDSTCSICFVEKATHAAIPCSHVCCEACWSDVLKNHQNTCPFCRTEVQRLEPVASRLSNLESLAASIEKQQQDASRLEEHRKALQAANLAKQYEQSSTPSETPLGSMSAGALAEAAVGTSLESSKIRWLIDEIRIVTEHEKVLVVSQWTSVLDHIADMLALHAPELRFVQLDGRTAPMQRAGTIETFQTTNDHRICLVSLGACAEGVTLTAASRVYHMDLWWNDAKDYQMANRIHRIGQTRDVKIVHIITEDTIEDKIAAMREKKRKISNLSVGTLNLDDDDPEYYNNVRLLFDLEEEAALIETRRRKIYNLNSSDEDEDNGSDLDSFIVD